MPSSTPALGSAYSYQSEREPDGASKQKNKLRRRLNFEHHRLQASITRPKNDRTETGFAVWPKVVGSIADGQKAKAKLCSVTNRTYA
jgi:hypothetical protein